MSCHGQRDHRAEKKAKGLEGKGCEGGEGANIEAEAEGEGQEGQKMPRREEERPERRDARGKRRREKTFKERFQDWISGECDGVGRF